jgi:hypothetical protein
VLTFIQTNPLMVLGIVGAVLTLIASIYGVMAKKKAVSIVATFMVLSCLVVVGKELVSYNQAQQKALLEENRREQQKLLDATRQQLIEDIQTNVIQTRVTVEDIAARLASVPLAQAGTPLVTVRGAGGPVEEVEEILAHGKGPPGAWAAYADWLEGVSAQQDRRACLSLTLNRGSHYVTGMLLAYLYTDAATRDDIAPLMRMGGWDNFPDQAFTQKHGIEPPAIDCLLIYDQEPGRLIAYAKAGEFVSELLAYQKQGLEERVEDALNRQPADMAELRRFFPSLSENVLRGDRSELLVKAMIEQQLAEATVVERDRTYLLQLERLIMLAATTR